MKIQKIDNTSFNGVCIARYTLPCGKSTRQIDIYQLENRDISILKRLMRRSKTLVPKGIEKPDTPRETWTGIIFTTLQRAFYSLKMNQKYQFEKDGCAKLIAVSNGKFCGVLVGNMPKVERRCSEIVRSWTGKPRETELNWFGTTPTSKSKPEKGIGTVLTAEFFNFLQSFEHLNLIRVKSYVYAEKFYKTVGFRASRPKVVQCETDKTPRELASLVAGEDYEPEKTTAVYAMQIPIKNAAEKFEEIALQYNRIRGDNESVDLANVIEL